MYAIEIVQRLLNLECPKISPGEQMNLDICSHIRGFLFELPAKLGKLSKIQINPRLEPRLRLHDEQTG